MSRIDKGKSEFAEVVRLRKDMILAQLYNQLLNCGGPKQLIICCPAAGASAINGKARISE